MKHIVPYTPQKNGVVERKNHNIVIKLLLEEKLNLMKISWPAIIIRRLCLLWPASIIWCLFLLQHVIHIQHLFLILF
jgi:hypothetical protein